MVMLNLCTKLAGNVMAGFYLMPKQMEQWCLISTIEVCPKETTTYTLTVTDANGCSTSIEKVIYVRCGNNPKNPK
jgi:hypothetical protein